MKKKGTKYKFSVTSIILLYLKKIEILLIQLCSVYYQTTTFIKQY